MSSRAVSFVKNLTFDFVGNVYSKAMLLGDVRNDGTKKLVCGSTHGALAIFADDLTSPWATASDLGSIASMYIGDVFNIHVNCLVVLTAEGLLHVFDLSVCDSIGPHVITPVQTFFVPTNISSFVVHDLDGDGLNEMIIGSADRVVDVHRMYAPEGGTTGRATERTWQLLHISTFYMPGQISSVSISHDANGAAVLLVGQPGGVFFSIDSKGEPRRRGNEKTDAASDREGISTEVLGDIKKGASSKKKGLQSFPSSPVAPSAPLIATSTLDGNLFLQDLDGKIYWELLVDHQLFALSAVDINADGSDEIVVCAWDGMTYILDHDKNSVAFRFKERVSAFVAGHYTVGSSTVPVLVYATFADKIIVYYDVHVKSVPAVNAVELVGEAFSSVSRMEAARLIRECIRVGNSPKALEARRAELRAQLNELEKAASETSPEPIYDVM